MLADVATMNQCGTLSQSQASVGDFYTVVVVVTPTGSKLPRHVGSDAVIRRICRPR